MLTEKQREEEREIVKELTELRRLKRIKTMRDDIAKLRDELGMDKLAIEPSCEMPLVAELRKQIQIQRVIIKDQRTALNRVEIALKMGPPAVLERRLHNMQTNETVPAEALDETCGMPPWESRT